MTKLFAISGRIASGKTTIACGLSEFLRWKVAPFGNFVRYEAQRRGESPTRATLQDLGRELVHSDIQRFCNRYLEFIGFTAGEDLVIDGMRHLEVFTEIKIQTNASFAKLISVNARTEIRRSRFARQEPLDSFAAADSHPVEAGNDVLESVADFRLDTSTLAPDSAESIVINWAVKALRGA